MKTWLIHHFNVHPCLIFKSRDESEVDGNKAWDYPSETREKLKVQVISR